MIVASRADGVWTGTGGIVSSIAAMNTDHLLGLAILLNDKGDSTPVYSTFDGESVGINDILIKYTYNGDADLNGQIDADDYFQIDNGFSRKLVGYRNGDFDFNKSVDADDYFLIDRAFVGQTGALGDGIPPAQPARVQLGRSAVSHTSSRRRERHHRSTRRS